MKPEFLKELGLNEEQIMKICAENDKEVSAAKGTGEQSANGFGVLSMREDEALERTAEVWELRYPCTGIQR